MTRFFVQPEQIDGDLVSFDSDDSMHLDRVLRAKPGEEIGVLDGSGTLATAVLTLVSKGRTEARIVRREELNTEAKVKITVAQALPKTAEKLEWVLQHGVEVGAGAFWIFRSRRSEASKLAEKPERWAKIVKTAAEQSGRALLPEILLFGSMSKIAERAKEFDLALVSDEAQSNHPQTLGARLSEVKPNNILVMIGPEGGWSDEERLLFDEQNIEPISLGRRILRTETAALVVVSQILFALAAS